MTRAEVPDALFPSDNNFQIPSLRLDMQADFAELPIRSWGSREGRKKQMHGTWHFYVDDYRFEALWRDPSVIVNTQPSTIVEPNYSVFGQTPMAVAIHATYRKRWIARYCQEYGIRVMVDLNVNQRYAKLNLLGVPKGWRAYATHGYSDRIDDLRAEYDLACERRGSKDVLFVCYGGSRDVDEVCRELGIVHISEERRVRCTEAAETRKNTERQLHLRLVS